MDLIIVYRGRDAWAFYENVSDAVTYLRDQLEILYCEYEEKYGTIEAKRKMHYAIFSASRKWILGRVNTSNPFDFTIACTCFSHENSAISKALQEYFKEKPFIKGPSWPYH